MNLRTTSNIFFVFIFVIAACGNGRQLMNRATSDDTKETILFPAASLVDARRGFRRFNEEHPGVQVEFNFGSGALMQQILRCAAVCSSANESHFEEVVDEGYIDEGTR